MELLDSPGFLALGLFFLFIILNFPIAVALGMAAVLVLVVNQLGSLSTVPKIITGAIDSFTLLAIPLFVLAGSIIAKGGIATRLVHLAQVICGGLPGGLAITVVIAGAFLGALSGSNVAAIAALGFMIGAMHRAGYPLDFSCAVVAAGCTFGVVIPPSINLILYGVIANASIPELFAAGIGPGLLLAVTLSGYIYVLAKKRNFPTADVERGWGAFIRALGSAVWGLMAPLIILGGIYGGVFTATEAAAVAVIYVFMVDRLVYREITLSQYPYLILNAGVTTGVIMLILAMASGIAYIFMLDGTAGHVQEVLTNASGGSSGLALLLINVILFVAGAFLDPVSAIYLLVPLFLPTVGSLGIDVIHFGAIMTTNLSMAHITPPIGLALYLAAQIGGIPFLSAARAVLPLVGCEILVLLVVTYVPEVSLYFASFVG